MENVKWDNKFGVIEGCKKVIDGIGKDAEIVTNQFGGKQSAAPMALHLIDPDFFNDWFNCDELEDSVIFEIAEFMKTGRKINLLNAIYNLNYEVTGDIYGYEAIVSIAKVLKYGAEKYRPNNWRLIPQEENLNHALIHYIAYKMGDTQDDHLEHCMCRLMMAYATKKSPDFAYNKYVPEESERVHN